MLADPADLGGGPTGDLAEAILADRLQGGFALPPDPGDQLEVVALARGRRRDRGGLAADGARSGGAGNSAGRAGHGAAGPGCCAGHARHQGALPPEEIMQQPTDEATDHVAGEQEQRQFEQIAGAAGQEPQ